MIPPLLLHVFPSFAIGGAQARFITLAARFGARYRHAIVAMDGDTSAGARLPSSVEVSYPRVNIRKGDTLGNLRRIRRAVAEIAPDVLITSNWGSIEWALINLFPAVPHIHMEDGFGPEERDHQLPRRVWTRRLALRRALVMLPSRTLLAIAEGVWKLPRGNLRYIPNGIDLTRFRPVTATTARDGAKVTIGTVAGLRAEKNVERLLRAFAILRADRPASLIVAGDGPERARLERLAGELGIAADVSFVGQLDDPAPLYHRLDIFALSSDTEQMPISVLEAMAAGLPVAATDVGDIAGMISTSNAGFLAARDAPSLADSLARLASDVWSRRTIGAANRARVEQDYDLARMVRAHAALIEEARVGSARRSQQNKATMPDTIL
jgi:glycosyltransferase involved in cell wall biosynthesis